MDAGIDRTYVSRLERDLENPTVAVLERLSKALRCEIGELFNAAPVGKAIRTASGRTASALVMHACCRSAVEGTALT